MKALSKENRNYFMGIAIMLVTLHHLCIRSEGSWNVDSFPFSIFYWGQIGVDFFFFLSAFGCCASWENNSWQKYLFHRIKRIYPQYIVFLIIVLVCFFADSTVLHRLKMIVYSLTGLAPLYWFGGSVEWYIPSLLMMYFLLPFVFKAFKRLKKNVWIVITLTILFSPWLLNQGWICYPFQARVPLIMCGFIAYINRDDLAFLMRLFAFTMLLTLTTREEMMIHSMMIPFLMVGLSIIELKKYSFLSFFSFLGKHSMEIFLAQTITTQYMMQRYFWFNKWLSLGVILISTTILSVFFWGIQFGFNRVINNGYNKV